MEIIATDQGGTGIAGAKIAILDGFFYIQRYEEKGELISNAGDAVGTDILVTNEKGKAIGYLIPGKYTLEIAKEKYGIVEKKIEVGDREKTLRVKLETDGEDDGLQKVNQKRRFVLGDAHGGVVTEDGSLYMWGGNYFGTLGDDTTTDRYTPVKVLDHVTIISLGWNHSGAITEDGNLYMWGSNSYGQLGDGTTTDRNMPVKVLDHVTDFSLSGNKSGAITEDGNLYMWGSNSYGQLGDGTTIDRNKPVKVLENVISFRQSSNDSGAITEDSSLYMWGRNNMGQLGDGTTTDRYTPVKIFDHVTDASLDDFCSGAITEDGSLYMWGSNHGALGDGTTTDQYTPVKVLSQVKTVSLNGGANAITKDGNLYVWGTNEYGQLGDGTYTPVKLLEHVTAASVSAGSIEAGGVYGGAVTEDGSLYMWGRNNMGQLGDGTTTDRFTPVKILDHVKDVCLGTDFSGAITKDGSLYMWGNNFCGQLGDGTTEDKLIPTRISIPKLSSTTTNNTEVQNNNTRMTETQSNLEGRAEDTTMAEISPSVFQTEETIAPANYTVQEIGTTGNIRFFDLIPDETYNFYVVESRENENPLEASNLLYINQYIADSYGSLAVTYEAKQQSDTAIAFVTGMSKMNLEEAEVSVSDLIANGSTQYAMPKVVYRGTLLTEGVDYEVTDNVGGSAAGTYSVTLTGIGLYTGEVTMGYRIVENPYMEDDAEADTLQIPVASVPSGTEVDAGTKVRLLAETVGAKIYYTLDGTFPTKESTLYTSPIVIEQDTTITAYVVREGYIDSATVTFRYTVKDTSGNGDVWAEDIPSDGVIPNGLWMSEITEQAYTGKAIKPVVRVYDYKTLLAEKKDYMLTYKNNIKANDASVVKTAPMVTVTGKGNYSGKETQSFVILPKNISDEDVLADPVTSNVTGKAQYPIPKLTWQGKSLAKNRDFTVSYPSSNGEVPYQTTGTYEIRVEGNGNYIGQRTITFTVTDNKPVSKLTIGKIGNQLYTGAAITPAVTVKDGKEVLKEGEDYSVTYQNNVSVGTATAVINGMGDYEGYRRVTYKITALASVNKAKAELTFKNSAVYTGQEVKPDGYVLTATVKDTEKKSISVQLQEGTDYIVSYQNNHKAGTATIIFTGINGYNGTLKKTYKIAPYDINADGNKAAEVDKKIAIRLRDSYVYVKGGCKPEPIVTFQGKILKKGTDYTLSYKNNTKLNDGSNTTKLPTITVKGKGNFKGSCSRTYLIGKQELKRLTLTAKDKVWQNKENIYKTTVTLTDVDGKKLNTGKDYDKNMTYVYDSDTVLEDQSVRKAGTEVSAQDIIPADTVIKVTVNAVENGNYTGKLSATYRITKADIAKATVKIPAQTYTGKAIEPDDEIKVMLNGTPLSEDNYEIVAYQNNVNKGTATVTIRGKNDCGGTKSVKFKIKQKGFIWWRK